MQLLCVFCHCCKFYCSRSRLCWAEETTKRLGISGQSKKKAVPWNQSSKKNFFWDTLSFLLPWTLLAKVTTVKRKQAEDIAVSVFRKSCWLQTWNTLFREREKWRNNPSITIVFIVNRPCETWSSVIKYCKEKRLLRERQWPGCPCSVTDGESCSRSCQRASYCRRQLLHSFPWQINYSSERI